MQSPLDDPIDDARGQADKVACELAGLHDRMTSGDLDLFYDLARDAKDRSYAFGIG